LVHAATAASVAILLRLHGDNGGPLFCPLCAGEWNAKHTKRRKFGRIVLKAMNLYIQHGGSFSTSTSSRARWRWPSSEWNPSRSDSLCSKAHEARSAASQAGAVITGIRRVQSASCSLVLLNSFPHHRLNTTAIDLSMKREYS
jgi:hypothetical protein